MKPRSAASPAPVNRSSQASNSPKRKDAQTPTRRKIPSSTKAATTPTQTYKKANPLAALLKSFKRGGAA